MKKSYKSILSILFLLPVSMGCHAVESPKAAEPMKEMGMHHGMGMMGGMTQEQQNEHMRSNQEHMLLMHDLSNQIIAEKDAAKKEALKKQQLELMKTHHDQMMQHHQQKMMEQKTK